MLKRLLIVGMAGAIAMAMILPAAAQFCGFGLGFPYWGPWGSGWGGWGYGNLGLGLGWW